MVLVTFRVTVREDLDQDEFHRIAERMHELVGKQPGFEGIEWYAALDDPRTQLALAVFDSHESIAEWKSNPEHLLAQKRGQDEFFERYRIQIADVRRAYAHPA